MSFTQITSRPVSRRRLGALAALAFVAAMAAALVMSSGASAETTSVFVDPTSSTGLVGSTHVMTATVFPVESGVRVRMKVLSGPNANDTASALTNSGG